MLSANKAPHQKGDSDSSITIDVKVGSDGKVSFGGDLTTTFTTPGGQEASMSGGGKDLAPEAKQALVTERINARWNALIKGDLDQAYTFMSAGSQEAMPLKVYKAKINPGMWRAVKIDSMDCEAEICQVKMTLTYDHRMMKGIQTPFQETWILEKGNAWYVYRDRE
jgi:hypothetical protein